MPLPSSGLITLNGILTEFGAPVGTTLNQMVKGGAFVSSTVAANIPTAPPIRLSDFYGAFRPPALEIKNALASAAGDGQLTSSSVADMTGSFGVTIDSSAAPTATPPPASAIITLTVPLKVLTATTPNLFLSVNQFNPQGGGFIYPNQTLLPSNAAPFDHAVPTQAASGPGVTDTEDSYQGSWGISMPQLVVGIGSGVGERVHDAVPLGTVVDNDLVNVEFTFQLTFGAYIGNQSNFGQLLTFDLGPSVRVVFAVSFMFLDGDGNLVQEVPAYFVLTHRGRLRSYCIEFG